MESRDRVKRILLVEDDEDLCMQLGKSLRKAGYEVKIAEDGYAALKFNPGDFDLLITDIYMPGLGGLELIMELRETCPDLKSIAISGGGMYKNMDVLKKADTVGASQVLEKPFVDADLIESINRLIGQ